MVICGFWLWMFTAWVVGGDYVVVLMRLWLRFCDLVDEFLFGVGVAVGFRIWWWIGLCWCCGLRLGFTVVLVVCVG